MAKDAALARMKGNLNGKLLGIFNDGFYVENHKEIAATIGNHEPMLVVLVDYYDHYPPTSLATLQSTVNGRILGVRESLFPAIASLLTTYVCQPEIMADLYPDEIRKLKHPIFCTSSRLNSRTGLCQGRSNQCPKLHRSVPSNTS